MFSGVIPTRGIIRSVEEVGTSKKFVIQPLNPFEFSIGASIAVNGVCLTVESFTDTFFSVTAVEETLKRTNLSVLFKDQSVHLEPSLRAGSPIDGHFVLGHVDCTARMISVSESHLEVELTKFLIPYVTEKGSVTLDGVSLTVASVLESSFTIALIPHTVENTNFLQLSPGSFINVEVDPIARYLYHFYLVEGGKKS